MNKLSKRLNKATDILVSQSDEIRKLVKLSGFDMYTYFEGANLSSLNLEAQDLTGFSFYNTDLRGSKLPVEKIDPGTLNKALVDNQYSYLQDDFDISILELATLNRFFGGNVYIVFRAQYIEYVANKVGLYYYELARKASIHQKTLKSARSGNAVMWSTAQGICQAFSSSVKESSPDFNLLKNPAMYFTRQISSGRYGRMEWHPEIQDFTFSKVRLDYQRAFGSQFNLFV